MTYMVVILREHLKYRCGLILGPIVSWSYDATHIGVVKNYCFDLERKCSYIVILIW
jgi:hypothetical protein